MSGTALILIACAVPAVIGLAIYGFVLLIEKALDRVAGEFQ